MLDERRLEGTAIVTWDGGATLNARFELDWSLGKNQGPKMTFTTDDEDKLPKFDRDVRVKEIQGTTIDGETVSADMVFWQGRSEGEKVTLRFEPTEVSIGTQGDNWQKMKYGLTNVDFLGTEWSEEGNRRWRSHFAIPLTTESGPVKLEVRKVDDFDQRWEAIKTQRHRRITATATLWNEDGTVSLQRADEIMSALSWLLSFASGRRISWVRAEAEAPGARLERIRDVRQGEHGGDKPLIPTLPPHTLPEFLAVALPEMLGRSAEERKALAAVQDLNIMAVNASVVQQKTLLTANAFEMLIEQLLPDADRMFVPANEVAAAEQEFIHWIEEKFLTKPSSVSPEMAEEWSRSLKAKYYGLFQRSFLTNLKVLLKRHAVPFENKRLRSFIDLRNDVTHGRELSKPVGEVYRVWAGAHVCLDTLVLRLLKYEGQYYNRDTWELVSMPPTN